MPTLFLDIDGVLADFVSRAAATCGCPERGAFSATPPRDWDIAKHFGVSSNEMWRSIDKKVGFWEGIAPLPWLTPLTEMLCAGCLPYLLSAPSRHPSSASGKVDWVSRHAPHLQDRLILCPAAQKHFLAAPGRMLVDDREVNCRVWEAAGGTAFLFPAPWNCPLTYPAIHAGILHTLAAIRKMVATLGDAL